MDGLAKQSGRHFSSIMGTRAAVSSNTSKLSNSKYFPVYEPLTCPPPLLT